MAINKITTKSIKDLEISAADLAPGTITGAKIAPATVESSNIAPGTIASDRIAPGTIANDRLANNSITINGTSIALGASGEIVAGTDWQSVTVADGSTTLNATAGAGYFLDTNAGVIEVFLPGSPTQGDTVTLVDYAGTFATNNVIVNSGTNNIDSTVGSEFILSTNNRIAEFVYVDSNKGWLYKGATTRGSTPSQAGQPVYDTDAEFISATGGTVTTDGNYKIHSFTGDGCFAVTSIGNPAGSDSVEYLVVAGGGGNGGAGGGGGAGGFRASSGTTVGGCYTAGPAPLVGCVASIPVTASTTYPVTVGAGGGSGGPACQPGTQGSPSVFSTITSTGGGAGGGRGNGGGSGGSGGGGGDYGSTSGGAGNSPPVSPPQGFPGKNGTPGEDGGGGGGATSGGPVTSYSYGAGAQSVILGTPYYFAAGGNGDGGGPTDNGRPTATYCKSGVNRGYGSQTQSDPGNPAKPNSGSGKGIVVIRYKYQ